MVLIEEVDDAHKLVDKLFQLLWLELVEGLSRRR